MNQPANNVSRRQFLGSSAKNAAGVAAGLVGLNGGIALGDSHSKVRVGVVGTRTQGTQLATALATFPDVTITALCDVDANVLASAAKSVTAAQTAAPQDYADFRKLLDSPQVDAVVIATPNHWHAAMTVLAVQAGKDVYVESPVSRSVLDGQIMLAVANKHERVIQTGLQQRSGAHFQSAIELLREGKIGTVKLAKAWTVHRRKPIGHRHESATPAHVDYDLWLGPATERPFQTNRFHQNWHCFWDYGSGELGQWGVHLLDFARWGLDVSLPERITASGGKFHLNDDRETPDTMMVQYDYTDVSLTWEHRLWTNHGIEGRSAAVAFYGDQGTLIVDRGGWKVYDQKRSLVADASEQKISHLRNFINCVQTREQPTADLETGHLSTTLCHLGNIAYRLGRQVQFSEENMNFGEDAEANAFLSQPDRTPWQLLQLADLS